MTRSRLVAAVASALSLAALLARVAVVALEAGEKALWTWQQDVPDVVPDRVDDGSATW